MPGLGSQLSHSNSAARKRKTFKLKRKDISSFSSGVSDWSASTGASLSDGPSDDRLVVATGSGSSNAHGYQEFVCVPRTTYNFSIEVLSIGVGTQGKIWIGTSAGDNTHHSLDVTSTGTKTFTFTPTGTSFFVSLVTTAARNNTQWDNLSIEEV